MHRLKSTVEPQHRQQFQRDGYLVIDGPLVSEETLDAIISDLDGLYKDPRWESGTYFGWQRIQEAWKINSSVKSLALAPKVLSLLKSLYGRTPVPFQTLNFCKATEQKPHADAMHFNSLPTGYMCGVWVALEDIDTENGPIVYYPGSHKLPEVTPRDLGVRPSFDNYLHYVQYVADLIQREGLAPQYACIAKGQALIWASNLLHGGARLTDPTRTRHSQVTHYFFEGCQYWTPMVSDGEDVSWLEIEQVA